MSRRHPEKRKRQTKITIPSAAGPHVKLVFAEMSRQNVTYDEVEEGSGILRSTLKAWRHKNAPGLTSIEAVLGFLGFDFVPVPRAEVLPRGLVEALAPLAVEHNVPLQRAIEAFFEIAAGILKPEPIRQPESIEAAPISRRPRFATHPDQPEFFAGFDAGHESHRASVH